MEVRGLAITILSILCTGESLQARLVQDAKRTSRGHLNSHFEPCGADCTSSSSSNGRDVEVGG